jgi:hypothetical protein
VDGGRDGRNVGDLIVEADRVDGERIAERIGVRRQHATLTVPPSLNPSMTLLIDKLAMTVSRGQERRMGALLLLSTASMPGG